MDIALTEPYVAVGAQAVQVLRIIWIDVLLSGDNAIVIALACRALAPAKRRIGILSGAATAVALRILFTLTAQYVLSLPHVKIAAGLLLLWIAVKLLIDEEVAETEVAASDRVVDAIRTIAVADMIMSMDNVLAVAGAAGDNPLLIAFGLMLSLPLVVIGATAIMRVLTHYPALVWAGAALLGWIAGELLVQDGSLNPWLADLPGGLPHAVLAYAVAAAGAGIVLVLGFCLVRPERRRVGG